VESEVGVDRNASKYHFTFISVLYMSPLLNEILVILQ